MALEEIGKQLILKSDVKDLVTLLDVKANVDDINEAFSRMQT
jgi:hypothetical protein